MTVALVAAPAVALSKSGTVTCTHGATAAARGEQQRYGDRLTLYVGGNKVFESYNVYTAQGNSNLTGTQSWSGNSVSLLLAGTYGRCIPSNV